MSDNKTVNFKFYFDGEFIHIKLVEEIICFRDLVNPIKLKNSFKLRSDDIVCKHIFGNKKIRNRNVLVKTTKLINFGYDYCDHISTVF